jgi:hypothetical protein
VVQRAVGGGVRGDRATRASPAPARKSGFLQLIYRNSLSIALLGFFVLSFVAHLLTGLAEYNEQQALREEPPITATDFLSSPEFWFQSMQNWQSEFLAVGALVVLSIVLRQPVSARSSWSRFRAPSLAGGVRVAALSVTGPRACAMR